MTHFHKTRGSCSLWDRTSWRLEQKVLHLFPVGPIQPDVAGATLRFAGRKPGQKVLAGKEKGLLDLGKGFGALK